MYAPFIMKIMDSRMLWPEWTYGNPMFRMLEFIIGVAIGVLSFELKGNRYAEKYLFSWWAVIFEITVYIVAVSLAVSMEIGVGDYMLYSAWIGLPIFSLMLFSLLGMSSPELEKSKLLKYLCSISYAFYMAQLFSNRIGKMIIEKYDITNNLVKIVIGWGACAIIAVLLHEIIEKKIVFVLKKKVLKM